MTYGPPRSFGAQLKALREAAGYTQEELATIAGLSVHAVSAVERGERRRPHVEAVRALSAALDLTGAVRDAFVRSARAPADTTAVDELSASRCRWRSRPFSAATYEGNEGRHPRAWHWSCVNSSGFPATCRRERRSGILDF